MMKMLIKFDEEKIEHEGEHDLKKMEKFLNDEFAKRGIYKDDEGLYVGGDFSTFGSMIWSLSEMDWFLDNASKWVWYDSEGQADSNVYGEEELLEHYKRKRDEKIKYAIAR